MKKTNLFFLFLIFISISAWAQNDLAKSQAVFIYNFTRYIQWPESEVGSYYVIGVFGNSPVYNELTLYTQNKQVAGKPIRVVKCNSVEDARHCHILFISDDKSSSITQLMSNLKGTSCLTVFENSSNLHSKAVIDFIRDEQKLKYRVNEEYAGAYKIVISDFLVKMSI